MKFFSLLVFSSFIYTSLCQTDITNAMKTQRKAEDRWSSWNFAFKTVDKDGDGVLLHEDVPALFREHFLWENKGQENLDHYKDDSTWNTEADQFRQHVLSHGTPGESHFRWDDFQKLMRIYMHRRSGKSEL